MKYINTAIYHFNLLKYVWNLKMTAIIDRLSKVLGTHKVTADKDILCKYSVDETSDLEFFPDILVRAETVEDVSNTLKICNEFRVPVTPRGAGTGVTGGSVPVKGGLVLSTEKMNRIIEIDKVNMIAVVQPGVITYDLQKAALKEGLMYPPDPASLETCSIGGNVAENAGGPKAVKYGITKDYVLGLETVLADGTLINTGGKTVKNATGYNLTGIILGSEGTLAVITKIYLRLVSSPHSFRDILIPFDSMEKAVDAVNSILLHRIVPAAIEFMEKDAIDLVSKYTDESIPHPEAGAHLLIQIDGDSDDAVYSLINRISEVVDVDGSQILVADSLSQSNRIWKARRSIRESITNCSPVFLAEDCVVPRSVIPLFLKSLKEYFISKGLFSVMFGHAGDGNVHVDILKGEMDYQKWKILIPELKKEIYKRAIDMGGTITGEHGIGYLRKDYLSMALSKEEISLQQRIKKAFDPNLILNPEKIFPFSEDS